MTRFRPLSALLVQAVKGTTRSWASSSAGISGNIVQAAQASTAARSFGGLFAGSLCNSNNSLTSWGQRAYAAPRDKLVEEPNRKFRSLGEKELWHEAWMYEDRFGSEEDPIIVPSLEVERIIGVTDPEDDNLVVWGILKAGEPPKQFIEGGEFYLLKKTSYVKKVGDVLDELEASKPKTPLPA